MGPEMLLDDSYELRCVVSLNQAEVVDTQLGLGVSFMSPLERIGEGRVLDRMKGDGREGGGVRVMCRGVTVTVMCCNLQS